MHFPCRRGSSEILLFQFPAENVGFQAFFANRAIRICPFSSPRAHLIVRKVSLGIRPCPMTTFQKLHRLISEGKSERRFGDISIRLIKPGPLNGSRSLAVQTNALPFRLMIEFVFVDFLFDRS